MMTRVITFITAISVLLYAISRTRADTIELTNGDKLDGRIISENEDLVVIEISLRGVTLRKKIQTSRIASIYHDVREGPGYYPLPIIGPIGRDLTMDTYVTADAFSDALFQVRTAKPDYVLLVIDSIGGSIEDTDKIVSAIANAKDLSFVAYVQGDAISAAAVIAMTCPVIVMAPDAVIGAAVPYQIGPDGTPKNIEEKFQSAIRARFTAAAKHGGHSPLLVQGMMQPDIELSLIYDGDKPLVVESESVPNGEVIKKSGQILTLTADQALKYGLVSAIANTREEACKALEISAWHEVEDAGWYTIKNRARSEQIRHENAKRELARKIAEEEARQERIAQRKAQIDLVLPEVSDIEQRRAQLHGEIEATDLAMQQLEAQRYDQLSQIERERQRAWNDALISDDPGFWCREVNAEYQREYSRVNAGYDAEMNELQRIRNAAALEIEHLNRLQQDLLSTIPH